jgi:hypothetical protein
MQHGLPIVLTTAIGKRGTTQDLPRLWRTWKDNGAAHVMFNAPDRSRAKRHSDGRVGEPLSTLTQVTGRQGGSRIVVSAGTAL